MMNPKIKKALQDPYYACSLLLNRVGRFVSDENFVKWTYYLTFRKKLDLDNPKTFNEKLQWLKLNDQHEEYTQMVDKYEAKKYVANLNISSRHWVSMIPSMKSILTNFRINLF